MPDHPFVEGLPCEFIDSRGDDFGQEVGCREMANSRIYRVAVMLEDGKLASVFVFTENLGVAKINPIQFDGKVGFSTLFGVTEGKLLRPPTDTPTRLALVMEGRTIKRMWADSDGLTMFLDVGHVTFDGRGVSYHGADCRCSKWRVH